MAAQTSIPPQFDITVGPCVVCSTKTTTRCRGCIEGVDIDGNHSPAFYCGSNCQKANWPVHKKACQQAKLRLQLFRAGALGQQLFLQVREAAFDVKIGAVEHVRGGKLKVTQGIYTNDNEIFDAFPANKFKDEQDKKAMLCWYACGEAVLKMPKFLYAALDGAFDDIFEANIQIKPDQERILFYSGGKLEQTNKHLIFKVNLKDGHSYAIDFSGPQIGQYECVVLWEKYMMSTRAKLLKTDPGGYSLRMARDKEVELYDMMLKSAPPNVGHTGITSLSQSHISDRMNIALDDWLHGNTTTIVEIIRYEKNRSETEFKKLQNYIVECITGYVKYIKTKRNILEVDAIMLGLRDTAGDKDGTIDDKYGLSEETTRRLAYMRLNVKEDSSDGTMAKYKEESEALQSAEDDEEDYGYEIPAWLKRDMDKHGVDWKQYEIPATEKQTKKGGQDSKSFLEKMRAKGVTVHHF